MGNKAWILRDINKRIAATQVEAQRNAYLAVARNTTLPAQTRHKAQLALNQYNDGKGRMVSIRNRCMWTGRGGGECYFATVDAAVLCGRWEVETGPLAGLWRAAEEDWRLAATSERREADKQGVLNNFAQCRFQFRKNALAGNIPGMQKGSW